jgi:C4-dicarboxylate transporter, DctM subunit
MTWLTLVGGLSLTISAGAAIGAALGLIGLVILKFHADGATDLAVIAVHNTLNNFTLSALPLFVIMGDVIVASGLGRRVYSALAPAFRRLPGKLLHTNIALCVLFGAISGSSTATAGAAASVAYPELTERGYDKAAVLGGLAGGGTLGLLIPPSLSLLLYGAWQDVSIGRLFLAGILPGLMMAGLFMVWIALRNSMGGRALVPAATEPSGGMAILASLLSLWPVAVLILAVLGTLYMGLATPTEAAGLGVAMAIVVGMTAGDLTWQKLVHAFSRSTQNIAALAFVLIGAVVLGQAVSILGLPREVIAHASGWGLGRYEILFFVVAVYLVLGCFFDGVTLMLLTLPFLYPLVIGAGFDPVWFGVFVTIMVEIGLITPPVGMNLFVLAALSGGQVPVSRIAMAALPYWFLLLVGTLLITVFPSIVLWLPRMFG